MKRHVPNLITLLNLFFGCVAVVAVLFGNPQIVLVCFFLSGLMDFGDGFAARLLKVSSPVGKELDSLADMVSFGVLPGMIFFKLLDGGVLLLDDFHWADLLPLTGFIFTMAACMRLAKFNLDTRQSLDFIGLNTPTATGFVVGLYLINAHNSFGLGNEVAQPGLLLPIIAIFSYLMLSEFPMFSGKFRGKGWKGNEVRFIFLILVILEFIFFGYAAFSVIVLTYILLSAVVWRREERGER